MNSAIIVRLLEFFLKSIRGVSQSVFGFHAIFPPRPPPPQRPDAEIARDSLRALAGLASFHAKSLQEVNFGCFGGFREAA